MSEEEKKEYEELKSLLYTGTISQYGKRKLIDIIDKQQKEIKDLKEKNDTLINILEGIEDLKKTNRPIKELVDELNKWSNEYISKNKIKEIIKLTTQNKEIVKLPNNETICVSDCYELLNYLQELLEEGE